MKLVYVGIDVAKEEHFAEVKDRAGNTIVPAFPFGADLEGHNQMLTRVKEVSDRLKAKPIFGMEATGIYHMGLYAEISARGHTVKVYNPLQLRAFRKKSIRKTFTDKTSSSAIADMLRFENVPTYRTIAPEVIQLREYCRARHRLFTKIRISKTQVRRNLSLIFPGYDRVLTNPLIKCSRALLKRYTTPKAILDLGEEKLAEIIRSESGGQHGIQKARELLEACKKVLVPEHMIEPCSWEIKLLIEQIEFQEKHLKELDAKIEELFSAFEESKLFESIGGIGKVTAAAIYSNFGPMRDFPHPDKAVAFAGLDPSVFQSGMLKGSIHHISKRGSPHLRHVLYQAANVSIRYNPVLIKVYKRKREEGLSHRSAVCVAARKLIHILYSIATSKKPFAVPAHVETTL